MPARIIPLLEVAGRDTMRLPDPGRKRRKALDNLLAATRELVMIIDPVEQRTPRNEEQVCADAHYSGKKSSLRLKARLPDWTHTSISMFESKRCHHRQNRTPRVQTVVGLANLQLRARFAYEPSEG